MSIFVEEELIDEKFFIYRDSYHKEWHWGDTLNEIQARVLLFLLGKPPIKEDDAQLTQEEIESIAANIKQEELSEVKIKLTKPNFGTTLTIESESIVIKDGVELIDHGIYTYLRFQYLMKGWNFQKDGSIGEGDMAPITIDNYRKLHPSIAAGIVSKINDHVPHYRTM